jgi:DNA-binding SARP family transcriptional activator
VKNDRDGASHVAPVSPRSGFSQIATIAENAGDSPPAGLARHTYALTLLGGLRVNSHTDLPANAALKIAAFVTLYGPTSRSRIAGQLWPEVGQGRALGNLRSGLWKLRRTHPGLVAAAHDEVILGQDVAVDVRRISALIAELLESTSPYVPAGADALLTAGELLPEWDDDWVVVERQRLENLRLAALDELARRYLAARRETHALRTCDVALSLDPLRETALDLAIRALLAQGNLAAAHDIYARFARALHDELGVRPGRQLWASLSAAVAARDAEPMAEERSL